MASIFIMFVNIRIKSLQGSHLEQYELRKENFFLFSNQRFILT